MAMPQAQVQKFPTYRDAAVSDEAPIPLARRGARVAGADKIRQRSQDDPDVDPLDLAIRCRYRQGLPAVGEFLPDQAGAAGRIRLPGGQYVDFWVTKMRLSTAAKHG